MDNTKFKKLEENLKFYFKIYDEVNIPQVANIIFYYYIYVIIVFLECDDGIIYLKQILTESKNDRFIEKTCRTLILFDFEFCKDRLLQVKNISKDQFVVDNIRYVLSNYDNEEYIAGQQEIINMAVKKCKNKYFV